MTQDRRTFLKTTALATAAAAAGVPFTTTAPLAQQASVGAQAMARGFVFATLRRQNLLGLGVRTDRGVLDVAAAEQELKEGAPTTISDVLDGKGDLAGLRRLTEKAKDSHLVPIDKAAFGPCVTHPERSSASASTIASTQPRPTIRCRRHRSCSTSSTPRSTIMAA